MKVFLILMIALAASCNDETLPEASISHESQRRIREWIEKEGVEEIYLYTLDPNERKFQVEEVFMGNMTSEEAGLSNFPD